MSYIETLRRGHAGEDLIIRFLVSKGYLILPAYKVPELDNKGPQLFTPKGDFVVPDMLAFREGRPKWIETKTKTALTWHYTTNTWLTGIDRHHYEDYLRVSSLTGIPVYLMFLLERATPHEQDRKNDCPKTVPTGLFVCNIKKAPHHKVPPYDANRVGMKGCGKHGMVYWELDYSKPYASLNEVMAHN